MNESELEKKIQQKLEVFERQEAITPTQEWETNLQRRINRPTKYKQLSDSLTGLKIFMLLIVIINIIIVLSAITKKQDTTSTRKAELETIYNEILFNTNSSY